MTIRIPLKSDPPRLENLLSDRIERKSKAQNELIEKRKIELTNMWMKIIDATNRYQALLEFPMQNKQSELSRLSDQIDMMGDAYAKYRLIE